MSVGTTTGPRVFDADRAGKPLPRVEHTYLGFYGIADG